MLQLQYPGTCKDTFFFFKQPGVAFYVLASTIRRHGVSGCGEVDARGGSSSRRGSGCDRLHMLS